MARSSRQKEPTYVLTHTDPFGGSYGLETTVLFDALRGKQGVAGLQVQFYVGGSKCGVPRDTDHDGRAKKRIGPLTPGRTYLIEARLVDDDSVIRRTEVRVEQKKLVPKEIVFRKLGMRVFFSVVAEVAEDEKVAIPNQRFAVVDQDTDEELIRGTTGKKGVKTWVGEIPPEYSSRTLVAASLDCPHLEKKAVTLVRSEL